MTIKNYIKSNRSTTFILFSISLILILSLFPLTLSNTYASLDSNSTLTNSNSTLTNSNSTLTNSNSTHNNQNGTITSFPGSIDSDRRHMPLLWLDSERVVFQMQNLYSGENIHAR